MTDDGLFVRWFSLAFPPESFEAILRTFLDAFPEVHPFYEDLGGMFLFGSARPIGTRPAQRIGSELAARQHAGLHADGTEDMLSRWFVDFYRERAARRQPG